MLRATLYRDVTTKSLAVAVVLGLAFVVGIVFAEFGLPAFLWILAGLVVLVLLSLELTRHGFLALLLSMAYVLGGNEFARLHLEVGPLPLHPGEFVLALSWMALIMHLLVTRRSFGSTSQLFKPFVLPFLLLYLVGVVSFFRGSKADLMEALRDSAMVYYSSFVFFVPLVITSRQRLEQALRWFLLTTAVLTVLLALSWVFPLPFPVGGPGVAAHSYLSIAIIFELLLLAQKETQHRSVIIFLIVLQLFVILIMQVRSVWIGLASVLAVFLTQLKRHWLQRIPRRVIDSIVLIIIFSATGLSAIRPGLPQQVAVQALTIVRFQQIESGASESLKMRLEMWSDVIHETLRHPLLGIGLGTPFHFPSHIRRGWVDPKPERRGQDDPHNSHLTVLLRMGVIGLGLWLLIFWRFIQFSLRFIQQSRDPKLQSCAVGILLSVVMILVTSAAAPILEIPYVAIPFWLMMGAMLTVVNLDAKSHTQQA